MNQDHRKNQEIQTEQPLVTQEKEIQTDRILTINSPRKTKLKKKNHLLQKKLRKMKEQLKQQKTSYMKDNKQLSLSEFCDATDQLLPPSIATFVKVQANLSHTLPKGRKFSLEFKKMCLSLYLNGRKSYEFLSKQFCLPSTRSLRRMTQNFKILPGLQNNVFDILKSKISTFETSLSKYCILCMDEASLKANLFYNISQDMVYGFEDCGEGKSILPACNVAVLMVRGVCLNWKQPIGYFFLNSTFPATRLKDIITQSITKLQAIGYIVIAFVSDMGQNFMSAAKELKVTIESPYFIVNNQQVAYLIDSPHAVKASRNNCLKNKLKYNEQFISWQYTRGVS